MESEHSRRIPYNFKGEYGPASTDVRNRMTVGGSINFKWNVRVSPFVTVQSGPPFDITAGNDLYGTTLFNGRPGIPTDPNKPGLIATRYGLLDPNPSPGEPLLSRNFGRGPGQISVNLRVGKTIGFGAEHEGPRADVRPGRWRRRWWRRGRAWWRRVSASRRFGRWDGKHPWEADHKPSVQPDAVDVGPEPFESQQPRADHRQYYVATVRSGQSDSRLAKWRGVLRDRE